ncbi:xanthine dehydrogenase family protein molybdopterin-binding subunit [Chitinophaga ginsengisegetis]|uniref:xanthine dehydrogenase family protein molybdopterin-binding subunit n=1 Tax=Chitinophaga ginsengisegetis TaxID=393003 RepID=UPI000DB931E1|nr:xanthine dehydrogenase family protein molybdopterin-binding subunit [Chitinophaga ginsengisegetis]MDR6567218.1 xanthine dehydrogenase YagR molybdenum-binding subunit [Chitinophaga ginsengisegetis]MDR6646948.1 xanthine dehydrogenase YagR molybdenum-binding subunit [Chitinophaga ginsengisegetis]MDR6653298.1 xanthine dehydrogenase YagR molybdenum-binding subunit [Chitinophaga ginsengisegetis]
MKKQQTGQSMDRVDGRLKVTGGAKYFADHQLPELLYAALVCSSISNGTIKSINTTKALRAPGVQDVISHLNAPPVPGYKNSDPNAKDGLKIFKDNRIYSNGQPVAIVLANTMERAVHAASLVEVQYNQETHYTDMNANMGKAFQNNRMKDYTRGEADAWKKAPVTIDATYSLPLEVHNPMELAGIIAHWDTPDTLVLYAKTQGVKNVQDTIKRLFQIPEQNITVHSQFVGGGFGMALRVWPLEIATIVAAKKVRKPVKLVITRDQMFTLVGYRPTAVQRLSLGATADGKLTGITHEAVAVTSPYEDFTEGIVSMSKFMYACPNVTTRYKLVPLNISTPIWMRGPGEATGAFALESAIDELSYKLNIDPLELRVLNHADTDPEKDLPFSSKYLKEAYQLGAEKIGWSNRKAAPRSMQEDGMLVGYGMSSGTFGAFRGKATVSATLKADGSLILQSAAADIGPGTATAMVQIAADVTGIAPAKIKFMLGESAYPFAPQQGGSSTVSTLGSAVTDACKALQQKLAGLAISHVPAFKNAAPETIIFEDGRLLRAGQSEKISYETILQQQQLPEVNVVATSQSGEERKKYSMYSFSVHFTKVHVHPATGVVRIKHIVSVADAGTIVNAKTARSQMIGGVVGGIGMALTEEAVMDHRFGRFVNNNYADYHVPVNADTPPTDVYFINKKDPYINPMGSKGMGEIALIGFAAAVSNAVYHATGKRVRDLPITPDKVLDEKGYQQWKLENKMST